MNNELSEVSKQTIKRLSKGEVAELDMHIHKQYGASFEEGSMLRDDIKDKVFELINLNYTDPKFRLHEHHTFIEITMDSIDITALSDMMVIEFNLDNIPFSETMKWQTLKDVITYIEEALECALHDRGDS